MRTAIAVRVPSFGGAGDGADFRLLGSLPTDGGFSSLQAVNASGDTVLYGCGSTGLVRMTTAGNESGIIFNTLGTGNDPTGYGGGSTSCEALISVGDSAVGILNVLPARWYPYLFRIDGLAPTRGWNFGH